ncbi:MAG: hypothetical protein WAU32_05565 [Thermoanaerobaculia bacterium]
MPELQRIPRDLHAALGGEGFRRRRRLVLPLLTTDPEGFPRVALLTLGEVRANSVSELAVAVRAESRTAFNLVRRGTATLLYLHRAITASVQARAGRGRVSSTDPGRRVFPLSVERVRVDRPTQEEGDVELLTGPTFAGSDASDLFSEELFAELGKVKPE